PLTPTDVVKCTYWLLPVSSHRRSSAVQLRSAAAARPCTPRRRAGPRLTPRSVRLFLTDRPWATSRPERCLRSSTPLRHCDLRRPSAVLHQVTRWLDMGYDPVGRRTSRENLCDLRHSQCELLASHSRPSLRCAHSSPRPCCVSSPSSSPCCSGSPVSESSHSPSSKSTCLAQKSTVAGVPRTSPSSSTYCKVSRCHPWSMPPRSTVCSAPSSPSHNPSGRHGSTRKAGDAGSSSISTCTSCDSSAL